MNALVSLIVLLKNIKNPLWTYIDEYITHLQFERRLSSNTLYAYKYDLKIYTEFLFEDLMSLRNKKQYKYNRCKYSIWKIKPP